MNDLEHVHNTKYFIEMTLRDLIAVFDTRQQYNYADDS